MMLFKLAASLIICSIGAGCNNGYGGKLQMHLQMRMQDQQQRCDVLMEGCCRSKPLQPPKGSECHKLYGNILCIMQNGSKIPRDWGIKPSQGIKSLALNVR